MRVVLGLVVVLCAHFACAKRGSFPMQLERCYKTDPKLNDCLLSAMKNAMPHLAKGIPSAGIMPTDPLFINELYLEQDYGPVTYKVKYTNFSSRGYSTMKLYKVRANLAEYSLKISGITPRLTTEGTYDTEASVFFLPLEGKGNYVVTMDEIDATLHFKGEKQMRGGDEYMKLKKVSLTFDAKKVHIYLGNLFNGDERLGKYANKFINRYALEIVEATKPLVQEGLAEMVKRVAEPFFKTVPFHEIFL